MAEPEVFDVVVVGAGVVGSSTAYHLALRDQRVVLLDQFPLPHSRGSSHSHSRLLRRAYRAGQENYSSMVKDAQRMWRVLEEQSAITVYNEVGVLSIAFDPKVMEGVYKTLDSQNVPHSKLTSAQLGDRFPMLPTPPAAVAIVETEGGVLYAQKALQAFRQVFVEHGGVVRDGERVTDIIPGQPVITVRTSRGATYRATSVVLTPGPWVNRLRDPLGLHLPLQPWRVSLVYWREKSPGMFAVDRFPCLRYVRQIEHNGSKHNIYCTPSDEYPGLFKLCLHVGLPMDPDERDSNPDNVDIKLLVKFVSKWMPHLDSKPVIIEKCFYTMTPDEGYILDTHPRWPNIVVGAGFSGHGFKLAPVSGSILADLAMGKSPDYDMTPFRCTRFRRAANKSSL